MTAANAWKFWKWRQVLLCCICLRLPGYCWKVILTGTVGGFRCKQRLVYVGKISGKKGKEECGKNPGRTIARKTEGGSHVETRGGGNRTDALFEEDRMRESVCRFNSRSRWRQSAGRVLKSEPCASRCESAEAVRNQEKSTWVHAQGEQRPIGEKQCMTRLRAACNKTDNARPGCKSVEEPGYFIRRDIMVTKIVEVGGKKLEPGRTGQVRILKGWKRKRTQTLVTRQVG
jgi:hypothetical protein